MQKWSFRAVPRAILRYVRYLDRRRNGIRFSDRSISFRVNRVFSSRETAIRAHCDSARRGRRAPAEIYPSPPLPMTGSGVNITQGLKCRYNFGGLDFQIRQIWKATGEPYAHRRPVAFPMSRISTEIVFACLRKFELTEITLVHSIPECNRDSLWL